MTNRTLALDFGTSGLKAGVFAGAKALATASADYPTHSPAPHAMEQDPADWARALCQVIKQLPAFDAVSITGQMQDLICLDAHYQPLRPAVLYSDTRATKQAQAIHAAVPAWDEMAGNEQSATSTAAQFSAFAPPNTQHLAFGPAGFITAQLGLGTHVDPTTASATGLTDIHADYLPAVAQAAGIDPAQLPAVRSGLIGHAHPNSLGISAGTPIISALGDAASTTIGTNPSGYVYLGTTGWYAQVLDARPDWPGSFHTLALPGGKVLGIAAVASAGAAAAWARNAFLGGATPGAADELLAARGRGATGITCIPSLTGERFPVRDDHASASLSGIRAHHTAVDLYAAVLEGVARSLAVAIPRTGGILPVTGGGATSRPWLEIFADATSRTVAAPATSADAALRGAVIAAHQALGWPAVAPVELGAGIAPQRPLG